MMARTSHPDPRPDPMIQLARELRLSRGVADVLALLRWVSLASADDIGAILSRPVSGVLRALGRLRGLGLVESGQLGCTMRQRGRWYFTDLCLERTGLAGVTWHDEAARCRLLEILPALEQFYQVVGAVQTMGHLIEFQWLDSMGVDGPSCDAVVRYEGGWSALFWCGSLLSETILADRLTRFPVDCQELALGAPRPWPNRLCLVVMDEWQQELASRVLRDLGMEGQASVHCVADGTVTGPIHAGAGTGWVYQPLRKRSDRGSWEGSLETSQWSGAGGLESARVLEALVQWPGSRLRFLKAVLKEGEDQNRVRETCRRMAPAGLILQVGEGRNARYFATPKGLRLRAGQDRVHYSDARRRTGLSQWQEASPTTLRHTVSAPHEDGLRDLLSHFMYGGCPVANGTRYTEHLGDQGGIAPDAVVRLTDSPYGPLWHFVEYERSARRRSRVEEKLRGYGSQRRRDRYPVILVCWDDRAEAAFQGQGRDLGLAMVTTTLKRLRQPGSAECWSLYGQPAILG